MCLLILLLEARDAVTLAIPRGERGGTLGSSSLLTPSRRTASTASLVLSAQTSSSNQQQEERRVDDNADDDDHGELPADLPRRRETLRALAAVRRACAVTTALQPVDTDALETAVQKNDLSPVTVADFAVQACILHALHAEFPDAGFIAEEDSRALRTDADLLARVAAAAGLDRSTAVLDAIDLGKSYETWGDDDDGNNESPSSRIRLLPRSH